MASRLIIEAFFLLGIVPFPSVVNETRAGSLPDTPAGQIGAAFLKLFAVGDDEAGRIIAENFRVPLGSHGEPAAARLGRIRQIRRNWSSVRLDRVLESSATGLSILVTVQPSGDRQFVEFELEEQPPHALLNLGVRGPVDATQLDAILAPIDEKRRDGTIKAAARTLRDNYVFPEVGGQMADALEAHAKAGRYDGVVSAARLARLLTEDLQEINHDRHLRVRPRLPIVRPAAENQDEQRALARRRNHGFEKVELLSGNVGYIKFNGFSANPEAEESAAAALAFVARCDALIFDLRENGGGSPRMIEYVCSHLFEPGTHLNSFKNRDGVETGRTTTHDQIRGTRFRSDLPVYVLTSAYTFSAAEEFTYDLQQAKRATIVGETTGGGAHPVDVCALNRQFEVSVPYQRAENPISKSNWEGTGVVPDIQVAADDALEAAREDALKHIEKYLQSAKAETAPNEIAGKNQEK